MGCGGQSLNDDYYCTSFNFTLKIPAGARILARGNLVGDIVEAHS
jgi:hypothetical protein